MENRVYKMALEVLEEDIYDICDKFDKEVIANLVYEVFRKLSISRGVFQRTVEVYLGDLQIKIKNADARRGGSFLSISDQHCTCVARSLGEITDISRQCDEEDVCTLISMLNEAWFGLYN